MGFWGISGNKVLSLGAIIYKESSCPVPSEEETEVFLDENYESDEASFFEQDPDELNSDNQTENETEPDRDRMERK
jgi:hypothetical protein